MTQGGNGHCSSQVLVHTKPVSYAQPGSHSSPGSMMPFPHSTGWHTLSSQICSGGQLRASWQPGWQVFASASQ
jgi:hypothetical protein